MGRKPAEPTGDMLSVVFELQAALNDHVFVSNGIKDNNGQQLRMASIVAAAKEGRLSVNDLPNQWLSRYATAMSSELDELRADLRWKWWSKDKVDIQNIRVELIDILHFLVSAMISAGLTADDVHSLYKQKHAINIARQNSGYNLANKDEKDNRAVE